MPESGHRSPAASETGTVLAGSFELRGVLGGQPFDPYGHLRSIARHFIEISLGGAAHCCKSLPVAKGIGNTPSLPETVQRLVRFGICLPISPLVTCTTTGTRIAL
jgi:hypothetical protein